MSVTLYFLLLVSLSGFLAVLIRLRSHDRKEQKKGLKNLPPGSTGWPLLGETIHFAKPHPVTAIGHFMEQRIERYGKIFKTSIMGNPTVVSCDQGFNQFVLHNDGRLFENNWPKAYEKLLGKSLPQFSAGETHRALKVVFHEFLGVLRLRTHFMRHFELYTLKALGSWEEDAVFTAREETSKVTFFMILKSILSLNPEEEDMKTMQGLYNTFTKGFASLPVDLPFTNFGRAKKSREAILGIIERLKEDRARKREEGSDEIGESDYLGILLGRTALTTEQLVNLTVGMVLAGYKTSSTALTLAIYFLGHCPKAIRQLREEHLLISKKKEERGLEWEDYRQMKFTQCVINETMRLGNVTRYLFRRAKCDFKYNGYDIPSGWSVMPVFAATHLDGTVYKEPQQFDPWRWQDESVSKEMLESYMAFSKGLHRCAGMDLTKMEIAIFLHHLVLRYDWELAEPDHPVWQFGFLEFPKGLPIKVHALGGSGTSTLIDH